MEYLTYSSLRAGSLSNAPLVHLPDGHADGVVEHIDSDQRHWIHVWAYWNTELSAGQVTTVYNGGVPFDLSGVAFVANLKAWYRMGDGDTYPTLTDNAAGALHPATMKNMTAFNIVNQTP